MLVINKPYLICLLSELGGPCQKETDSCYVAVEGTHCVDGSCKCLPGWYENAKKGCTMTGKYGVVYKQQTI